LALHLQARYKLQLDPTVEEVKKLCNTCRKYAKSERALFHYNGHGVPKPTANGEIWVYNKVNVIPVLHWLLHVLIVLVFMNWSLFLLFFTELHPVYSASYH
jgi:hypothetical protein